MIALHTSQRKLAIGLGLFGATTIIIFVFLSLYSPKAQASDFTECRKIYDEGLPLDLSVNTPPIFKEIPSQQATVGSPISLRIDVCDKERMVPGLIADNLPAGASLDDNGDGTRTFNWTPEEEGTVVVTFTAYDEIDRSVTTSVSVSFSVTGGSANNPPNLNLLTDQVGRVGELLSFVVAPTDPDGDVPGVYVTGSPESSAFNDNLDGTRTFQWVPTYPGELELVFVAMDARDSSLQIPKTITVTIDGEAQENRAPYIEPIEDQTVAVGETLSVRVVPVDPDGVVPNLNVSSLPSTASFDDNRDGTRTFAWTPTESDVGKRTFIFTTTDANDRALMSTQPLMVSVVSSSGSDTTPPVITLLGDNPLTILQGSVFVDPGATAFDGKDGNITSRIVISSDVDTSIVGEYSLKYSVSDAAGNEAEPIIRTIIVQRQTPESAITTVPKISHRSLSVNTNTSVRASVIVALNELESEPVVSLRDFYGNRVIDLMKGDVGGGQNTYSAEFMIDTNGMESGSCRRFAAEVQVGENTYLSESTDVCVSSYPIGVVNTQSENPQQMKLETGISGQTVSAQFLLVTLKDGFPEEAITQIATNIDARVVASEPLRKEYLFELRIPADSYGELVGILNEIELNELVLRAVEYGFNENGFNQVSISNDTHVDGQWYLREQNMERVWKVAKGKNVTIAVIDSGIASRHPEFQEDVVLVGNNYLYDENAINIGDAVPEDLHGHGTHVSGIALARHNNSEGIAGIAPESNLIPVRVAGVLGGYSDRSLINAINWVADQDVQVVNISLGPRLGECSSRESTLEVRIRCAQEIQTKKENNGTIDDLCDAVKSATKKGALTIYSAGNDGLNIPTYLSTCNNGGISVGAYDEDGQIASFSNYGSSVDIYAPGVNIYSSNIFQTFVAPSIYSCTIPDETFYVCKSGTSMAAPIVSGAAALLWSKLENPSPENIKERLLESVNQIDDSQAIGLLDIEKALGLSVDVLVSKTGQTTSFVQGDDGDIESGYAWPDPRFIDNGNGTVTDELTGLTWLSDMNCMGQRYPDYKENNGTGDVTWFEAFDFISGINDGTYSDCSSGESDWRLPNIVELRSLLDYEMDVTFQTNTIWKYTFAFPRSAPFDYSGMYSISDNFGNIRGGDAFNSSTTDAEDPNSALVMLRDTGGSFFRASKTRGRKVWPVRGESPALLSSGQMTSYYPRDDGDLRKGRSSNIESRFAPELDGTLVLDTLTGLTWTNRVLTIATWNEAHDYIVSMNGGIVENFGFTDWRLPNIREVESLSNHAAAEYRLGRDELLDGVPPRFVWTSNTARYSYDNGTNNNEGPRAVDAFYASVSDGTRVIKTGAVLGIGSGSNHRTSVIAVR